MTHAALSSEIEWTALPPFGCVQKRPASAAGPTQQGLFPKGFAGLGDFGLVF